MLTESLAECGLASKHPSEFAGYAEVLEIVPSQCKDI